MAKTFSDVLKLLLPLMGDKRRQLDEASEYLTEQECKELKRWLKMGKVKVVEEKFGNRRLEAAANYPRMEVLDDDPEPEMQDIVEGWNRSIERECKKEVFEKFSLEAGPKILELIAPNIIGMEGVKEAALLQLFANERVHVLLLGDPGTGKTDILRAVDKLAPISSFGLGSGTSGAGLTVTVKGKETVKGLLPMANKGVCCIDELNLMKNRDRAGLLNAMEKGFVSYDKGNKHVQEEADVRVLATANPEGDQFAGWMVETLKKQLPFDPALLSRFHLVFLVRKPDTEGFVEISKKIVKDEKEEVADEDVAFVREYVDYTRDIDVEFDKSLEPMITEFVEDVKDNEDDYLIDVSPRLVVGIVRMSKASARISMRKKVSEDDVQNVISLVKDSLEIENPEEVEEEKEKE